VFSTLTVDVDFHIGDLKKGGELRTYLHLDDCTDMHIAR
jgi:hypothetical protein